MIRLWRPRCCLGCGEPLEEWKTPLQPGAYVACFACARLFVVEPDDGLTPVELARIAPELQRVFEDLLAVWWQRNQPDAAGVTTERKAA